MSILRIAIDSATRVLGVLRRRRRVRPVPIKPGSAIKVNLGCGLAVVPDWLNVDASLNALVAGWPTALHRVLYRLSGSNRYYSLADYCALLKNSYFIHHDLAHSIPFVDASVDYVYTSHFLEHLFEKDAKRLLREAYRVLKPGGVVRVCVPDLAHAMKRFHDGDKHGMLHDYFFVDDMNSFLARHKYMYDFELLKEALDAAGFRNVARCKYQQGAVPDVDKLDNRPEETLFVEATK